ncbi:hypothetical protein JF50_17955 [Pseudoalteromonas luteoviolacea]|uniref:Uncharacterized protein n=1 Tax=Pseudoalteromonas luteoviolacea TaxID=43657 RepID=A0A0C1MGZ1_9GAMM|nr:hypothetical protein JF50_17955 [Pseudoalteromonas luteoviolacea]
MTISGNAELLFHVKYLYDFIIACILSGDTPAFIIKTFLFDFIISIKNVENSDNGQPLPLSKKLSVKTNSPISEFSIPSFTFK